MAKHCFYQLKSFLVRCLGEPVSLEDHYCFAAKRYEVERWLNRP